MLNSVLYFAQIFIFVTQRNYFLIRTKLSKISFFVNNLTFAYIIFNLRCSVGSNHVLEEVAF
jgi:hypothetical protein